MIKKNISLTPEGKKELEKELDDLIKNRLPLRLRQRVNLEI